MRADIVPGAIFPDYEFPDQTTRRRKLSELQGDDPMILVLSRFEQQPETRAVKGSVTGRLHVVSASCVSGRSIGLDYQRPRYRLHPH